MKELREIIGENLTELRKEKKLTQLELAEKLNYSDKAISKWENGTAIPSIDVLVDLANLYGVTLDYLVKEGTSKDKKDLKSDLKKRNNHIVVTLLSSIIVWIVATIIYVTINLAINYNAWTVFCWAVPISCIVLIVFNGVWGKRKFLCPIVSVMIWTLLASVYLQVLPLNIPNMWLLFLLGIPLQLGTILWHKLK